MSHNKNHGLNRFGKPKTVAERLLLRAIFPEREDKVEIDIALLHKMTVTLRRLGYIDLAVEAQGYYL